MVTLHLPTLNACLNFVSATLLVLGFIMIKRGHRDKHKQLMLTAFATSVMFLMSYLFYHFKVGSVAYPLDDWTKILYLSILVPHIILATLMCPFIVLLLRHAFKGQFECHKRLAHWVWPIWVFVSASGVIIYFMLYQLHRLKGQ